MIIRSIIQMSYQDKLDLVRISLINHCKKCISNNWEQMFDMWLSIDAGFAFGHGYQDIFKEQYRRYMNSNIETTLFIAGKNIAFAIKAFMTCKKNANLNDILKFTENFILEQLDDFTNWCDEISQAMYEETSEYEREFSGDRKEDNPQ
jgi:hypothetical protein